MNIKTNILVLFALVLPCFGHAQIKVKGTLVDSTGEPVRYSLILLESNNQINYKLISDNSGKFEAGIVQGKYDFIVKQFDNVVFKKQFTFLSDTNLYEILIRGELKIPEVEILGKRKLFTLKSDRIVYRVDKDPFSKNMGMFDVFKRIPRIRVKEGNQVEMVGKNKIRYLINGKIQELSDEAMKRRLESMKSEDIQKIEAISIPPSKFNAEDNVGYINIITKQDETLGFKGDIYSSLNRNEYTSNSIGTNIYYSSSKFEFSLGGSFDNLNTINDLNRLYDFNSNKQVSDKNTRLKGLVYNINSILKYKYSNNIEVGITLNYLKNKFSYNSSDNSIYTNKILNIRDSIVTSDISSPVKPDNASLLAAYIEYKIDTLGKILNVTYNNYNKNIVSESNVNSSVYYNSSKSNIVYNLFNSNNNIYTINSLRIDLTLPFNKISNEVGVAASQINNNSISQVTATYLNNKQNEDYDYIEKKVACYGSTNLSLGKYVDMKFGLMYEYTITKGYSTLSGNNYKNSYGYFSPTAFLGIKINSNQTISLSYGKGIKRPDFVDLNPFRFYTSVYNYYAGNSSLQPSVTHNFEINYSNSGSVYVSGYYYRLINGIDFVTTFDNNIQFTFPVNNFNFNKYGAYISYSMSPFKFWSLMLSGDLYYTESKPTSMKYKTSEINGWGATAGLQSDWILNKRKNLLMHIGYTYFFPRIDDMTYYSSLTILDLNLRYSMLKDRLKITLRLVDPFDQNKTRSRRSYSDFVYNSLLNTHARAVGFTLAYSFGRNKVRAVNVINKDDEYQRGSK